MIPDNQAIQHLSGGYLAEEYDYYGRKKKRGLTGVYGDEYGENLDNAGNEFPMPDDTGAADQASGTVPQAGRPTTFTRQFGNGMKAVADTSEALSNPDNAPLDLPLSGG